MKVSVDLGKRCVKDQSSKEESSRKNRKREKEERIGRRGEGGGINAKYLIFQHKEYNNSHLHYTLRTAK